MANYNKSFNFRNGVQVDNSNFIVNSNGLVGIGTSIPREVLDVYGTVKVSGFLTATSINSPTITSPIISSQRLNVGIVSITLGIVTATSGIITYYGDGGRLLNLPTSQWIDVDSGFGYTSIYAAGNVGIGTTFPYYTLQIGGNVGAGQSGVGINSNGTIITAGSIITYGSITASGSINASGIITGFKFVGIGSDITTINASNISSGTLTNARLPQTISVAGSITSADDLYGQDALLQGSVTASNFFGDGSNITAINASSISSGTLNNARLPQNISITGIVSAVGSISAGQSITSSSFYGSGIGITQINASNVSSGTLDNARLPQNISVSGIVTTGVVAINNGNITGVTNIGVGSSTTSGSFYGSGIGITQINADNISSGTLTNARLPQNISVSGSISASSGFSGNLTGNVTGTSSLASNLTGFPDIVVNNIYSDYSRLGISTSTFAYVIGNVGIGTLDLSNVFDNVHIREDSACSVRITSDSAESYVAIGRSTDRLGQNAEIKYGNTSGIYPYSTPHTLDIINYSYGNINNYLHLGSLSGVGTGRFNWIYGSQNSILMSLTYDGNLGLGVTNPTNRLHVVGTSTVTDSAYFGSNLEVKGNTTLYGNVTFGVSPTFTNILLANVQGNLTGNVYTNTGVSTFFNANISQLNVTNSIGIGTTNVSFPYVFKASSSSSSNLGFIVLDDGSIGVRTSFVRTDIEWPTPTIGPISVDASSGTILSQAIGIGTTAPKSTVDFRFAGNPDKSYRYIILPTVSTSDKLNFYVAPNTTAGPNGISTAEGALIYNSTSKSVESYNGTKWNNLTNPFTETTNLNDINAGIITATSIRVGTGITIGNATGIVTAIGGFSSGIGTAVKITTVGNRLTFTVVGVGSTSLTLY
jgi:hypothetical protein